MEKEFLTPGKLYAKLSAQFHSRRGEDCGACQMPMVYLREEPAEETANWIVEPSPPACEPCQQLIDEIVAQNAERYDLWDPTLTYARPRMALFIPSLGHPRH